MLRLPLLALTLGVILINTSIGWGQSNSLDGPVTYEVVINGETFQIEGNRVVRLQSKEKPGTTYEIAVRVSRTQRIRLNNVQFEYDLPARISDDRGRVQRIVKVKHELGFSALITDLGGPVGSKAEELLKGLGDSLKTSFAEQSGEKGGKVEVTAVNGKFEGASGPGYRIQYTDASGFGHTCLAYVLSGEKFSVTCVVQFLDNDLADVRPPVKKLLDSFRPLP